MESTEAGGRVEIWQPLTREQLAESLIFERRRLAGKIAVAMLQAHPTSYYSPESIPQLAEDMAHAICKRLAARETGRPEGYK